MQACPDLVRGVCTATPLRAGDHGPGRGHPDEARQPDHLPPAHAPRLRPVSDSSITLEDALDLTRMGDVWLFRGRTVADRAIQMTTNSPINHVGMAVVIDDLPPLMWHAELGESLPD